MKNSLFIIKHIIYTILIVFICITCKKDDDESMAVKAGNWSGTDISFTVGGNPLRISDLEFSYSGHATGTSCSFDYESTASFSAVIEIEGNVFNTTLSTFDISGSFLSDTTAEIEINWTNYDSNCNANYTGNKTYIASYNSSR